MREPAGDRGIDAARDAQAPVDSPPQETSDRAKRRKRRRVTARTKAYLNEMRRD
jgi:hypothetical protein